MDFCIVGLMRALRRRLKPFETRRVEYEYRIGQKKRDQKIKEEFLVYLAGTSRLTSFSPKKP